jgi:hypothetical protein
MQVRIADPTPIRILGSGASTGGLLLLILAGFVGAAALVSVLTICAGVALVDAAEERRLGARQGGLFLLTMGLGLGLWALLVVALLSVLGQPLGGPPLVILAVSIPAAAMGLALMRPGAVLRVRSAADAFSRRAGQANTPATSQRRLGRVPG